MNQCILCKKQFSPAKFSPNQLYCSPSCRVKNWIKNNPDKAKESNTRRRKKWLAKNPSYQPKYNRWYWRTKKRKPRQRKKCMICTKAYWPNVHTPYQKYCSKHCQLIADYNRHKEKKHARYYALKEKYLARKRDTDAKYRDKIEFGGNRWKTLLRDRWTCRHCGTNRNLVVHHIDDTGQTHNPNNDLNNLKTLCRKCHIREHNPHTIRYDRFLGPTKISSN